MGIAALDFFSKDVLDENTNFYPNSKKFFRTTITLDNNEFGSVQMHIKNDNNEYIIYGYSRNNILSKK